MPPPELLKAYAEISADLPMRMMALAEKAQEHARELDLAELEAAKSDMEHSWGVMRRGQICGLTIGLGALVAGVACYRISPSVAGAVMGTILGGGGIGTLVWAFRYDRKHLTSEKFGVEDKIAVK